MPSNTRDLFDCRACGSELRSIYAIVQTGPIRERYIHWCPVCDYEVSYADAALRPRDPSTA